jgi:alkanesulfonate monooxygenase SsuD/methylene tetrahydromethanopterin reductase-like flavin-dependent oxidoreductase (luciferase family)
MLLTDLISRTKRITLAPLGMVVPTWDPIRLAESVAMVDQMAKGRFALGLARGYQTRWVQTLSQKYGGTPPATSDSSPKDLENREVFNEILKIMKMCWTQDTVRYHSEILDYSIPYPHDGIDWAPTDWTREFGAGELDENDKVTSISVIPRPYQDPHPPLWYPFALSDRTMIECAKNQAMPWLFLSRPDVFRRGAEIYQQACAENGQNLEIGQNIGTLRVCSIAETRAEADAMGEKYISEPWNRYFGDGFGYRVVLRLPEDEEKYPNEPLPSHECSWDRMKTVTYGLSGTVDDIKRSIEKIIEVANPEWFGWMLTPQQGWLPREQLLRQIELFGEHILPEFSSTLHAPSVA